MSEATFESNGACLCGKVTYKATLKTAAGACHCGMCRQWSGGPFMAVHATGDVTFNNDQHISRFSASPWAERGFCNQCGANLFYYLLPRPGSPDGAYMMSAGTVSNQSQLYFDNEVFIDHAPGWYQFADDGARKRLTEAAIMAMYSGQDKNAT